MNIKDILDYLTYNELSQHRLGGYSTNGVANADIPKIITTINQGIMEISKRTDLLHGLVQIDMLENRFLYPMLQKHAVVAGAAMVGDKFIKDSVEAVFPKNFRKFVHVYTPAGEECELNVRQLAESLAVPSYNTLQVPLSNTHTYLLVEFIYDPAQLTVTNMVEAQATEYPLPPFTVTALYSYVASKMLEGQNTESSRGIAELAMQKFEEEIKQIENQNVLIGDMYTSSKFYSNGFV